MESLYSRLGGKSVIEEAVKVFYRKILADDRVNYFFEGVNMSNQQVKQHMFLSMVFGGPIEYHGKNLRQAHSGLMEKGLDDEHFDVVVGHLGDTLREMGVGEKGVEEVLTIANSVRSEVLNR